MTAYSRPGVFVNEVALPQVLDTVDNGSAIGVFIGALPKGPVTPTLVSSWTEFVKTFGKPSTSFYTPTAVFNFFANGGRNAYIVRSAGTVDGVTPVSAAYAGVTLTDDADADTLDIIAKDPGTWANSNLYVEVVAQTSSTFGILVYETISGSTQVVEQFSDLSLDAENSRYVAAVLGALSKYVSADRAAYTGGLPAAAGLKALSGGASATDAAVVSNGNVARALVSADYATAYELLDTIVNPLVINLPDVAYYYAAGGDGDDATAQAGIYADLVDYCDTRGDAFAIVDTPKGLSAQDAIDFAVDAKGAAAGSNAAVYYPWIAVSDTMRNIPGATTLVPPGGAVLGQYLATDAARGVFKTPAGLGNAIALAVATERRFTNSELDTLNSAAIPVNAIRNVPGAGIVIMGGRTLKNTVGDRYVNVRRTLIYLKKELENLSSFAIFENNDTRLRNALSSTLSGFLLQFWTQGGLRGVKPQDAFYVKCDSTNNSDADLLNGQVNVEIGVALEYPAEFIVINIGQITGSARI